MTISIITAAASTLTDGASDPGLISQLNTALAPLLSDNIRGVSFITQGDDRLIGNELQVAITYNTSGAVITNPYVAVGFQAKSIEGVKTLMLAYLAAHPTYFFSTAWIQAIPLARQGSQYVGLIFYNTSAIDGAANWNVNGGGTVLAVTTGKTLWVDEVNGDNATGARGIQTSPYLTIQAAITAGVSGDTVVVRPGTYVQGLILRDGINLHLMEGVILSPDNINNVLFADSGATVRMTIGGEGRFLSAQVGDVLTRFQGSSEIVIKCRECLFTHTTARGLWVTGTATVYLYVDGLARFDGDAATITSTPTIYFRAAKIIIGGNGNGFNIQGGAIVTIEAEFLETAAQVLYIGAACNAYVNVLQIICTGTILYVLPSGNGCSLHFDCDEIFSSFLGFRCDQGALPGVLSVRARRLACDDRILIFDSGGTIDCSIECETIYGLMQFGGVSVAGEIRVRASKHYVVANHLYKINMTAAFWIDVARMYVQGGDVSPITIGAGGSSPTVHLLGGRVEAPSGGATVSWAIDVVSASTLIFDGATVLIAGTAMAESISVSDATPMNVVLNAPVAANKAFDADITALVQSPIISASVV